jgi:hypothetical protein
MLRSVIPDEIVMEFRQWQILVARKIPAHCWRTTSADMKNSVLGESSRRSGEFVYSRAHRCVRLLETTLSGMSMNPARTFWLGTSKPLRMLVGIISWRRLSVCWLLQRSFFWRTAVSASAAPRSIMPMTVFLATVRRRKVAPGGDD